jgi:SAM-dependent methyltransferase
MIPTADAVAEAAAASPLTRGPGLSELADRDELEYREQHESWPDPLRDVPAFLERKELVRKLEYALAQAGLEPAGTVVELGAGTCWLAATLARRPAVERVIGIEFSERRLVELAPVTIAVLGAPAAKVERRVADFYAHGLGEQVAEWVFMDAAFHHAADPVALARVAHDLLRPGGRLVLTREPTLSLLRRARDHGEEDEHGSFEHEYDAAGYLRHLRAAGFVASKHRASGGWRTPRARALLRPPLAWLNGLLFSEYTYVGERSR